MSRRTRKEPQPYRALVTIWHTRDSRLYEAGEICDLSHLSPDQITMLVCTGIVAPVRDTTQEVQEVTDGTDD